jgi:hypothetical protein
MKPGEYEIYSSKLYTANYNKANWALNVVLMPVRDSERFKFDLMDMSRSEHLVDPCCGPRVLS